MPRTCTVCRHADRKAVDQALVAGETFRYVSQRYGLSLAALVRHRDDHLPVHLRRAAEAQGLADALDLVNQIRAMNGASIQVLEQARAAGDGELALKAIDRVVRQLELVAKAGGQIDERPQVNLYVLPEFVAVQTAIVEALGPYPEAQQAVVARLLVLDGAGGHN
jgi:hypothetical protein